MRCEDVLQKGLEDKPKQKEMIHGKDGGRTGQKDKMEFCARLNTRALWGCS